MKIRTPIHTDKSQLPVAMMRGGQANTNESPQHKKIAQLEEVAARSPQMALQRKMAALFDTSPRMTAQRRAISGISDTPMLKHAAVQLKKITKPATLPDQQELISDIGGDVKQNVLSGMVTEQEKSDAIWTEALRVYNDNEVKGAGYASQVQDAVTKYQDATVPALGGQSPKEQLVAENTLKRSGYDTKFSANYSNAPVESLAADHYRVNTKGYDPAATAKPAVPTGKYKGDYSNEINLTDGSIKAAWNMAATINDDDWSVDSIDDEALAAGKGLNNSEILWQQYKLAAGEKHNAAVDKEAQVLSELKKISTIKRDTVINKETQVTVYMAYDDGRKWDANQDWVPGSSEFNAVLGTPNAKSSAFFLKDHMDQLEKTFDKITGTSSGGLDIKFTAI